MVSVTNFLKSEDGAVTVDWVVLTAAIIGIGMVVVFSVAGGASDVSDSLGASLTDANPPSAEMPIF